MTKKNFAVVASVQQVQVILPMPLPYAPVPMWLFSAGLFAIVLVPLWIFVSAIVRSIHPMAPPPRALFTITPDRFEMIAVDRGTGERTTFHCAPENIVELRKNRYDNGLWIHVHGKTMEAFLQDIDDDTIHALTEKLCSLLGLTADSSARKD